MKYLFPIGAALAVGFAVINIWKNPPPTNEEYAAMLERELETKLAWCRARSGTSRVSAELRFQGCDIPAPNQK